MTRLNEKPIEKALRNAKASLNSQVSTLQRNMRS
ncbi:Uncharacterised protein [Mycobacteroides abscessus subsp. abscessus]|nr:Uncharacterised protein [Mycobacteroides abscessus subsp. abscessus]